MREQTEISGFTRGYNNAQRGIKNVIYSKLVNTPFKYPMQQQLLRLLGIRSTYILIMNLPTLQFFVIHNNNRLNQSVTQVYQYKLIKPGVYIGVYYCYAPQGGAAVQAGDLHFNQTSHLIYSYKFICIHYIRQLVFLLTFCFHIFTFLSGLFSPVKQKEFNILIITC